MCVYTLVSTLHVIKIIKRTRERVNKVIFAVRQDRFMRLSIFKSNLITAVLRYNNIRIDRPFNRGRIIEGYCVTKLIVYMTQWETRQFIIRIYNSNVYATQLCNILFSLRVSLFRHVGALTPFNKVRNFHSVNA